MSLTFNDLPFVSMGKRRQSTINTIDEATYRPTVV